MHRIIVLSVALCFTLLLPSARAEDDVVLKAMRDELDRSMKQLQLEKLPKPYFVAYRVQERTDARVSATFGSLLGSNENRLRLLTVEVRVGEYAFDNTNFLSMAFGPSGVVHGFAGLVQLPLDNDYKELRRRMWLATDAAYKKALEDLSRKRAALQNKTRTEEVPDFSREEPTTFAEAGAPAKVNLNGAEVLVRNLSKLFRAMPEIFTSSVELEVSNVYTRYLNSEGTLFTRSTPSAALKTLAGAQAADGMPLNDFVAVFRGSMDELPKEDELAAQIREMGARLARLRTAPLVKRYNGPVLFEGQGAAEIFSQVMAPKLLTSRRPVSDNPQFEMFFSQAGNSFQDRLGARVLPGFLSVLDNPTLTEYKGIPLAGGYRVDDEGVRTRETKLVEAGLLKALLATRDPAPGATRSTGNRRGFGPAPSNLLITVQNGLSDKEIKEKLLSIVKERKLDYGMVVRRIGDPLIASPREMMTSFMRTFIPGPGREGTAVQEIILAYKVFPDGREELIRNAELDGLSPASFKDIFAASANSGVYSIPFVAFGSVVFSVLSSGLAPGETAAPVVSFVVPSMLFEDVTLKSPTGEVPKPPISKHPFFEK